jgi:HAD superfamily hydrolase (TIGR01509 family)
MTVIPDWQNIDTVFLDMDGTLLDLNFDTHFWREHVPKRYAQLHQMDLQDAKQALYPRFKKAEGTMDWYCLDYWSRELQMDIALLKEEVDHLITVFPNVRNFLDQLRLLHKHVVLVTNAHYKSLSLKMERTQLGGHLDDIVCAHDLGLPKENTDFWNKLQSIQPFNPLSTLLIDDSLPVLRSAQSYGIAHLLAVHQPDSAFPPKDVEEFDAIYNFKDMLSSLTNKRTSRGQET